MTGDRRSTLSELVEDYVTHRILRPASEDNYRTIVLIWIHDTGRDIVSQVNEEHVRAWRHIILKRASATTWNSYRRHLRALWNFAIKRNVCHANPFAETQPATTPDRPKKTVSKGDLNRLDQLLQHSEFRRVRPAWFWAVVLKTFYFTGIRRAQLTALSWNDIRFDDRSILLRSTTSKTHKEWSIPISDPLVPELENLHLVTTHSLNRSPEGDDQVFNVTLFNPHYVGKQMTVDQVSGTFQRLSIATGIRISPHRLRHTLATEVAPTDIRALQELLGHSSILTTMEYVHPDLDRMRSLINTLTLRIKPD